MNDKTNVKNSDQRADVLAPAESMARMAAFEQTGFVREVLAAEEEEEEVWNDL